MNYNQNGQNPYGQIPNNQPPYQQPQQRPQYVAQMEPYQQNYQYSPQNPYGQTKKKKGISGAIIACSLSAALVGGMLGGAAGMAVGSRMNPKEDIQQIAQEAALTAVQGVVDDMKVNAQPISANSLSAEAMTYSQIAEKVSPSVVGITIKFTQQQRTIFGMMENEVQGAGSGVIITKDGYILTNYHVIEGATDIIVTMADGTEYPATVIGKDRDTDIAVLKLEATNLPAIEIGVSSNMKVGDIAIVVGNPLGRLQGSVTQGIISALNRELTIDSVTMNLLQTDAAVNEGNSGGALVNAQGELIGIVNAKTSAVGVEGLGFAIPVDDVRGIIDDLMNLGYVTGRPKIGISGEEVTEQAAQYYKVPLGVLVTNVEESSAAQMAGVEVYDVITHVNGEEVHTVPDINAIKEQYKVGDTLHLTIYRNGETLELNVVLQESIPLDE